MPTEQERLDGERAIDRMKPTSAQIARSKHADCLWLLHSEINKLIAACAYDIIGGAEPKARKRELAEAIADVSAKYLEGE